MNDLTIQATQAFCKTAEAINAFTTPENMSIISVMAQQMAKAVQSGNKIMVCGNGGSACQAMHFAEELTGRYRDDRAAVPALCLTDASHITCVANDYGYEFIFSRAVEAYAKAGDHLLVLTTSGNSANLLKAVEVAAANGVVTHAFSGKQGGKLHGRCDHELIALGATSDCIQNLHMLAIHALIELIERLLFPDSYSPMALP